MLFVETAALAAAAKVDPTVEDTHRLDEETGNEVVNDKFLPLHARIGMMTISQKIRTAMLGNAAERLLLVRDSNRLVAAAAIKSPGIQENEVVRISSSRSVSDDVLRIIAMDREWTRSHQIKLNLVSNPRTPFAFSAKLITAPSRARAQGALQEQERDGRGVDGRQAAALTQERGELSDRGGRYGPSEAAEGRHAVAGGHVGGGQVERRLVGVRRGDHLVTLGRQEAGNGRDRADALEDPVEDEQDSVGRLRVAADRPGPHPGRSPRSSQGPTIGTYRWWSADWSLVPATTSAGMYDSPNVMRPDPMSRRFGPV